MRPFPRLSVVAACLMMAACSSNAPSSGSGGSGQSGASGGSSGSGGMATSGSGGSNANGSGGTSSSGSGGTASSGSGGHPASGGSPGSGGDNGTPASGGTPGSGGSNGSGGDMGSAGKTGSGGSGGAAGGTSGGSGGGAGSTAAGGAAGGSSGAAGMGGGNNRPKRVLLYSYSTLTISGVAQQVSDLETTLKGWGYEVDKVSDPMSGMIFSDSNLAKYAAVGMINTCFYPFGNNKNDTAAGITESLALKKFLQEGGGLFGTHCAQVTFTSVATMPLYNQLLGGWAHSGKNSGDNAKMTCTKSSAAHPTSDMLSASFSYTGNVDDTETKDATVLVSCTYGTSTTPVSWVRTEGAGRVFNTSFGKVEADLKDATLGAKHIILGLGWVLGR